MELFPILIEDGNDYDSFEDRVLDYLQRSPRTRERIPFLFLEKYQKEMPEEPPAWVKKKEELQHYWEIARMLERMYRFPLNDLFNRTPPSLEKFPFSGQNFADEELARLGARWKDEEGFDLDFLKKWRRLMQTFLRSAKAA